MSKERNIYPARTNQKLYFARLQLDLMQAALSDDEAFDASARALSCREAAIWHLHSGLAAFMQELSKFYKVQPVVSTVHGLAEAMAKRQQVSPEAQVLEQLLDTPDSWLAGLMRVHAACYLPVALPDLEVEADSAARIAIPVVNTDIDAPLSTNDITLLLQIHRELTHIIRGFRAELAEF